MKWLRDKGEVVFIDSSYLTKAIKHNRAIYGYLWKELRV